MRPRYLAWNLLAAVALLLLASLTIVAWVRVIAWSVLLARHWGWL